MKTQQLKNGLYALTEEARATLRGTKFYNDDLGPTTFEQRNWNAYNVAACWIGMNICIPAYQMASSAISLGMNWWLALLMVLLGNLIILVPLQLNSHVGTKYGIPFPVYARLSFGLRGAQVPSILRTLIGAGWTGILIYVGAECLNEALCIVSPGWAAFNGNLLVMFIIFWCLNIGLTLWGMDVLKRFESWSAPVLGIMCLALLFWAVKATVGAGFAWTEALTHAFTPQDFKPGQTILAMLVANIAFYSTWALNIPDMSRFAKSHKAQLRGQLWGLPTSMVFIAFIGVYTTGATVLVFGEPMWEPSLIIAAIGKPGPAIFAALAIALATLTTNVTTNILPPSNGICNMFPKKINFRMAVLITGALTIIMQPWALVNDPNGYIYNWLGTYGALTGPVAAIFIYDYYKLKKSHVNLYELYNARESRYWYKNGFNMRAIYAWLLAIVLPVIGIWVPAFSSFKLLGWLFTFALGFVFYPLLMRGEYGKIAAYSDAERDNDTVKMD